MNTNTATRQAFSTPASTSAQLTWTAWALPSYHLQLTQQLSSLYLRGQMKICVTYRPLIGAPRQAAKAESHHPYVFPQCRDRGRYGCPKRRWASPSSTRESRFAFTSYPFPTPNSILAASIISPLTDHMSGLSLNSRC